MKRFLTGPRMVDLYCGGGGTTKGYQRAGFYVVGIDVAAQPRYCGDEFHQADALGWLESRLRLHPGAPLEAVHASPPCHFYSTGTQHRKNAGIVYPDLLGPTQQFLRELGLPYVIENVPGAAHLMRDPVMLCGGMFGLGVMRHRFFETNWPLVAPPHTCNGESIDRDEVSVTRHGPPARWYRKHPGAAFSIKTWHDAMGIDWMNRLPLTQAIPPAYTEFIGEQLMAYVTGRRPVAATG